MEKLLVAGGGVLGSQIAFQSAVRGKEVVILDMNEEAIDKAKEKVEKLKKMYLNMLEDAKDKIKNEQSFYLPALFEDSSQASQDDIDQVIDNVKKAYSEISFETDKEKAAKDIDFVIEAIVENESIKKDLHKELAPYLPEKTVFASNSSTMVPSTFAENTGRPEHYLHFHFANHVWTSNIVEVMGHEGTDQEVVDRVVEFAEEIGMVPVVIKKEKDGYVINSLLVPLLEAANELFIEGYATVEDIDNTWKISTNASLGPFEMYDIIGLNTPYELEKAKPKSKKEGSTEYKMMKHLEKMINQGKLGTQSGEGFYKYDEDGNKI